MAISDAIIDELLKGVSAATFIDLTPIPPIIKMDKTDKRFINGKDVGGGLDKSVNLAAMHWDDFKHLIRELFEKIYIQRRRSKGNASKF